MLRWQQTTCEVMSLCVLIRGLLSRLTSSRAAFADTFRHAYTDTWSVCFADGKGKLSSPVFLSLLGLLSAGISAHKNWPR